MIDFTTTIAVDVHHAKELKVVWPTWKENRPEIFSHPLVLLCDKPLSQSLGDIDFVFADHKNVSVSVVPDNGVLTQREKMLSSLVFLAPWLTYSPWMLKLDCDVFARQKNEEWCSDKLIGGNPVFVSSSWGYTKPSNAIKILDDWGDTTPELRSKPRLNYPFIEGSKAVTTKGRIISWCFFGRTDWLRWSSTLCCRLPVPSQDTYAFFVAKRHGDQYKTVQMKQFGWTHERIRV